MPPPSCVRVAIIGQGQIGQTHASAVLTVPSAFLACIVDPYPTAAWPVSRYRCPFFTSIEEMLQDKSMHVDAAIVCTPGQTHVEISKLLLQAGIHVLCEKSICTDVSRGLELIQCAKEGNRTLLTGHHRRFTPFAVGVKRNLPSIGRLIAMSGHCTLYRTLSYFFPPADWRRSSSTAGPTLINLIHEVDLLHYWYGPIVRVYAEPTPKQRGFDAEEGAVITLRFQSGMVGTFLLGDAVRSPYRFEQKDRLDFPLAGKGFHRVFGEQGSLSVPYFVRWAYGEEEGDWRNEILGTKLEVPEMRSPFVEQVEHFVRVIRGEESPRCDGVEGLRAVMVCEAVRRSMREGKPVEIAQDVES